VTAKATISGIKVELSVEAPKDKIVIAPELWWRLVAQNSLDAWSTPRPAVKEKK